MEKFYSEQQEEMFAEARVISPFKKVKTSGAEAGTKSSRLGAKKEPPTTECQICYLTLPRAVRKW